MKYKNLSIYLGSKCNANCTYCHRNVTDDVSLSTYFLQNISENEHLQKIKFFGGEPTLYLSEMQSIINALPNKNIKKWISTNGLLLTDDKIFEFILNNNFIVTISYDGSRGLRNYKNIFDSEQYLKRLQQLNQIDTSTTIFSNNVFYFTDLLKEFSELSRKTKKNVTLYPHFMHCLNRSKQMLSLSLTVDHMKEYLKQYKKYVAKYLHDYWYYGIINIKLEKLNWHLENKLKTFFTPGETICVNCNSVKTDVQGNCYYCLYKRDKSTYLGTVNDSSDDILLRSQKLIDIYSPKCLKCSLYPHCGAACILSETHYVECYFYKNILPWYQDELSKYVS